MRVLVVSQYFSPELTAAAARVHAFAAGLAGLGHTVQVLCEIPNHPTGVVVPGYGGFRFDVRTLDGFKVTYVWVPTSRVKTTRTRMLGYGTFAAMACAAGAQIRRPDVVFASSPPLSVGAAGHALAVWHRAPWVLDVRDLWPDAAVAVGELRGAGVIRAARVLERGLYRSASAITTPSQASYTQMVASGVPAGKVSVLPSGTTRDWLELGEAEVDRSSLGFSSTEFVWAYAGNVGLAQDIATAVKAAAELGEGFRLVVVGDGPQLASIRDLAARIAPRSIFTGLVPRTDAGEYMRASDALLVSLARSPGLSYAVPSKLYDCCAVGRPVIVAADGEARRLSTAHGIALVVEPGEPGALAAAVRRLRDEQTLRHDLVVAARRFAENHLRERQLARLEALLASVAG